MAEVKTLRKVVQYTDSTGKVETFVLQYGHGVFGCNLKTGDVEEVELSPKKGGFFSTLLGTKSDIHIFNEKPHHLYIPSANIRKARLRYKKLFGNTLKIKGI